MAIFDLVSIVFIDEFLGVKILIFFHYNLFQLLMFYRISLGQYAGWSRFNIAFIIVKVEQAVRATRFIGVVQLFVTINIYSRTSSAWLNLMISIA